MAYVDTRQGKLPSRVKIEGCSPIYLLLQINNNCLKAVKNRFARYGKANKEQSQHKAKQQTFRPGPIKRPIKN